MFVLDASVTLSWAFEDESSEVADAAWRLIGQSSAAVPELWWFEIRNVLMLAERRGRIGSQQADRFLATLGGQAVVYQPRPLDADVFAIARRWHLTIYDASYLELAQRLEAPLATLDRRLAESARAAGVGLV